MAFPDHIAIEAVLPEPMDIPQLAVTLVWLLGIDKLFCMIQEILIKGGFTFIRIFIQHVFPDFFPGLFGQVHTFFENNQIQMSLRFRLRRREDFARNDTEDQDDTVGSASVLSGMTAGRAVTLVTMSSRMAMT